MGLSTMTVDEAIKILANRKVSFVTGTITVSISSSGVDVNLGFNPDLVIIYMAGTNNAYNVAQQGAASYYTYVPAILTNNYIDDATHYKIVENGFFVPSLINGVVLYYIAIKF